MTFGEKIKQKRLSLGLLQKQLAELVGISADTISSYEKKESPKGVDSLILQNLANALNISVDYLLNDDKAFIEHIKEFDVNNLEYLQLTDNIDLNKLFIEIIALVNTTTNVHLNNKELNSEDKSYIIDSLDICLKFIKYNSK